jgi:hypothetical protein
MPIRIPSHRSTANARSFAHAAGPGAGHDFARASVRPPAPAAPERPSPAHAFGRWLRPAARVSAAPSAAAPIQRVITHGRTGQALSGFKYYTKYQAVPSFAAGKVPNVINQLPNELLGSLMRKDK